VTGERILLAHGEGGKRSRDLIEKRIAARFRNPLLAPLLDSALLGAESGSLAFTTDGYVVTPPFFPGGDIGRLAVCGTVNDLAVCGAAPLALSCAFILEEGLPVETLERVLDSMRAAADEAGVPIVTGDTKVVERGKGDGIFVTTSGVGTIRSGWRPAPEAVKEGDRVILTGTMGDHHIAVLVARNRMAIGSGEIRSDAAPLNGLLLPAVDRFGSAIRLMRDATRGGVGVTLNELAQAAGRRVVLDEASLPVSAPVSAVCEILGFDPLFLANEGKALLVVDGAAARDIVSLLGKNGYGRDAAVVGEVVGGGPGVRLRTRVGGLRAIDYPAGDALPRIC
jgi:hydrogenase expression/formation protein HypE